MTRQNAASIGLASDHAGFALKQFVKRYLLEKGRTFEDLGCLSQDPCDYPVFAHALGEAIDEGRISEGIAICGTGEGMAMALNKHAKVRAALCWSPEIARMSRLHNDANVLVMPGRYVGESLAAEIMDEYFSTRFEGGRHTRRVAGIPVLTGRPSQGR